MEQKRKLVVLDEGTIDNHSCICCCVNVFGYMY